MPITKFIIHASQVAVVDLAPIFRFLKQKLTDHARRRERDWPIMTALKVASVRKELFLITSIESLACRLINVLVCISELADISRYNTQKSLKHSSRCLFQAGSSHYNSVQNKMCTCSNAILNCTQISYQERLEIESSCDASKNMMYASCLPKRIRTCQVSNVPLIDLNATIALCI